MNYPGQYFRVFIPSLFRQRYNLGQVVVQKAQGFTGVFSNVVMKEFPECELQLCKVDTLSDNDYMGGEGSL